MGSPVSDVMRSYATLASSLLERWSAHASKVAVKVDTVGYDAEDAAACASLATESGFLLAEEALDAIAALTGCGRRNVVCSQPFHAPAGATLKLLHPLIRPEFGELPAELVSIQPSKLAPTETDFYLRADASGYPGGTYVGQVQAFTDLPNPVPVNVWIVVP